MGSLLIGIVARGLGNATPPASHDSKYRKSQLNWFYHPRALPDGSFSPGARQRGLAAMQALSLSPLQATGNLIRPLGGGISIQPISTSWTFPIPPPLKEPTNISRVYGYGIMSIRVNAVAVHPSNPNIVYLGTSFAGVAKSTDGGTTWNYVTDGLPSQAIGSVTVDTTSPNIIYAGTGDLYYAGNGVSLFGVGIYRSTDSGATWGLYGQATLSGLVIHKIAIDPTTSGSQTGTTLYIAVSSGTNPGLYKSADSGQTWALQKSDNGFDIAVDTNNPSTVYFAAAGGLWKSVNAGAAWSQIQTNPTGDKCRLAWTTNNLYFSDADGIFTNVTFGSSVNGRVWRSSNGGTSWTELTTARGYCGTQCFYDQYIAVDPVNQNRIFFGGVDASRSSDSGSTITNYSNYNQIPNMVLHPDHHGFAFTPSNTNIIYEGNDGGIYKSQDSGVTWTNLNTNLAGGLAIGIGASADGHLVAGFQDDDSQAYSGSGNWTGIYGGDGGFNKIDVGNSQRMYISNPGSPVFAGMVLRTDNAGATFVDITPAAAVSLAETSMFYPTVFMNTTNSNDIFAGFQSVYRSQNAGASWTRIGSQGTPDGVNDISAIAESSSNNSVVYAGTDGNKVYVTANAGNGAGASWTLSSSGLPTTQLPTAFAVHPTNPSIAYVTFSQYGPPGSPLNHVYKTTNMGTNWTSVSSGLPDVPFNDIVIDTMSPNILFAASDIGVFNSTNAGTSWTRMNAGMPEGLIVNSLSLNESNRQLAAGTYGRAAYRMTLPSPPPAPLGLTGTAQGISSITWVWSASPAMYNVTTYGVYYATNSTVLIASGTATGYTWTGLSPNTTFSIIVTAANSNFESADSSPAPAATMALVPVSSAPSNAGINSITANWGAGGNPAGTNYAAQASTDPGFGIVNSSVTIAGIYGVLSGLNPNTTYFMRVQTVNFGGIPTAFVNLPSTSTLAAVPSNPFAAGASTASLTASWAINGNPLGTIYQTQLALDAVFTSIAGSNQLSAATVTISGLTANTSYYLQSQAINNNGIPTAFSSAQTVSTLANLPAMPPAPFSNVGLTSVTVQWTALPAVPTNATAEGYRVDASTAADFSGLVHTSSAAGSSVASLNITGLNYLTTYYFRVGSLNWSSVPNYIVLGATHTLTVLITSQTVVAGAAINISAVPPYPQLALINISAAANTFPAGANVTLNTAVQQSLIPPPISNEAVLTPLGPNVAFDLSASGSQPNAPVTLTLTYNPALLPANTDPHKLVVASYSTVARQWSILPTNVDVSAGVLTAITNHFTLFAPFVAAAGGDLSSVQIFPVPWQPGSGSAYDAPDLTFSNLPSNARVRLYTILGESLWDTNAGSNGVLVWNGSNQHGGKVGSGTYLAVIENNGSRVVRRVVVTR